MVVKKSIEKLMALGCTEYEARAYMALLQASPVTAYETARASGLPTSKIYEVLARLEEKGMVTASLYEGKKRFLPQDPEEFVESSRTRIQGTLDSLKEDLEKASAGREVSSVWNIHDQTYLMEKAGRMIEGARESILLSGWPRDMAQLQHAVSAKQEQGISVAVVNFGRESLFQGMVFHHPIEDTIYSEKGGRGLTIVVDSSEALVGTITDEELAQGAWSMNRGFVTLAEDYVKHDIYIMKIVQRFDEQLKTTFGGRYEMLRDVFSNREAPS